MESHKVETCSFDADLTLDCNWCSIAGYKRFDDALEHVNNNNGFNCNGDMIWVNERDKSFYRIKSEVRTNKVYRY